MASWFQAHVRSRRAVDDGLYVLALDHLPAVARAFERPGQFQAIRRGADEALFAIGSAPGAEAFEYLVRRADGVSEHLATLPLGAAVEVSAPQGPGFPLDAARGHDLLLVGTGTALAPLRSVLHAVARERAQFGAVTLLQGQRSPRQLPWLDELAALPNVDVKTTVTQPLEGWRGATGQVQTLVPSSITANTVAFLVGQPEMTRDVTALLQAAGVPPTRVFLNV